MHDRAGLERGRKIALASRIVGICVCLSIAGCTTIVKPPPDMPQVLRMASGSAKVSDLPTDPVMRGLIERYYRQLIDDKAATRDLKFEVEEIGDTGRRAAAGWQIALLPIDMVSLGLWGFWFPDRYSAQYRINLVITDTETQEKRTFPGRVFHAEAELRGFLGWRLILWKRMQRMVQSRAKANALHQRMHDLDRDLANLIASAGLKPPAGAEVAPARPGPDGSGQIKKRWAVVIGVSKYKDSRIPALRYASADARAFYDWLISPGGGGYSPRNVKLLLDEKATYANVREALYEWVRQAIAEDLVLIYIACHGSPPSPDEPENLFLLTSDTDYDKIASTAFPMWDVRRAIERFIRARKVVILADACHAGGIGKEFDVRRRAIGIASVVNGLDALREVHDGLAVFMASGKDELSQEDERWGGGHGVFTHYLLEGLKGRADGNGDGRVTITELAGYVSEQVRRATNSAQRPQIGGVLDPQLTLGR